MKKIATIFLCAFLSNLLWENLHSFLYESYKGGEITQFILVKASLFDALLITCIVLPFFYVSFLRKRPWVIVIVGVMVAILNEWYGLGTGRWVYNSLMPIVPLINVGLTPVLQLGVLGFLSYKFQEYLIPS